jgi:hypothetical protein
MTSTLTGINYYSYSYIRLDWSLGLQEVQTHADDRLSNLHTGRFYPSSGDNSYPALLSLLPGVEYCVYQVCGLFVRRSP